MLYEWEVRSYARIWIFSSLYCARAFPSSGTSNVKDWMSNRTTQWIMPRPTLLYIWQNWCDGQSNSFPPASRQLQPRIVGIWRLNSYRVQRSAKQGNRLGSGERHSPTRETKKLRKGGSCSPAMGEVGKNQLERRFCNLSKTRRAGEEGMAVLIIQVYEGRRVESR